jgi:hypothetical protein
MKMWITKKAEPFLPYIFKEKLKLKGKAIESKSYLVTIAWHQFEIGTRPQFSCFVGYPPRIHRPTP